ncbi:MAG TPA: cobalamin-binding protein [Anaerolineaceae bacterium]|nr:cobalamin-binding protein [Anaerolineaceae bacterium]
MSNLIHEIHEGILDGNQKLVVEKVEQAINAGLTAEEILNDAMIEAMAEAGNLFEQGEFFVPELLVAARAMQGGMELLKPLLTRDNVKAKGIVLAGTVKGDLHDIGKNLVCMMLEGSGFEIIDLGSDVDPQTFVSTIQEKQVDIVAMSALLTTTMVNMKTTIDALSSAGLRGKVKVMVGGAPVSQDFATKIGADGYAADANQAVRLAQSLLE